MERRLGTHRFVQQLTHRKRSEQSTGARLAVVRQNTAWHTELNGDVAVLPAVNNSAFQQRAVIWGQISARRLHPTRLHRGRHGSHQ
jgi:hypothetical protein